MGARAGCESVVIEQAIAAPRDIWVIYEGEDGRCWRAPVLAFGLVDGQLAPLVDDGVNGIVDARTDPAYREIYRGGRGRESYCQCRHDRSPADLDFCRSCGTEIEHASS